MRLLDRRVIQVIPSGSAEPNLLQFALLCEAASADGITMHLRSRRHVQAFDVEAMRVAIKTRLNLKWPVQRK